MSIRREALAATDHFTVIPNAWARDRRMSYRARGILAALLSHREGWETSIQQLVEGGTEGRDAIMTAVHELDRLGYLRRSQQRRADGRMGSVDYVVCEPTPAAPGPDAPQDRSLETRKRVPGQRPAASGSTVVGLSDDGSAVNGSPVPGNPHTKKNREEDHSQEDQLQDPSGADAPVMVTAEAVTKSAPKKSRGTRLPDDFPVTEEMAAWARTDAPAAGPRDHESFCDYWRSAAGARAIKADWTATWRNWMRKVSDERGGTAASPVRSSRPNGRPTATDRSLRIMELASQMDLGLDGAKEIGA